jgi:hypothetical protein
MSDSVGRWYLRWLFVLLSATGASSCDPGDMGDIFSGCDPSNPLPTKFRDKGNQTLVRDNYLPEGWYLDSGNQLAVADGASFDFPGWYEPAELEYILDYEGASYYAFYLDSSRLPLAIDPGGVWSLWFGLNGIDGPHSFRHVTETKVALDPDVLLLPVVTWSFGYVPDLGDEKMKYLFDRAPETAFPPTIATTEWPRQRVDELWAQCKIQFRHVGHFNAPINSECWLDTHVGSTGFQSCETGQRDVCKPNTPDTQDFFNCDQQWGNLCSLLEFVRYTEEQTDADGTIPHKGEYFKSGAINVYFTPQFDLYDSLTLGVGCAHYSYPMVILNDLWKGIANSSQDRRVLAHELGHVMGFGTHRVGTLMGGKASEQSDVITDEMCQTVRSYVLERYSFVRR